MANSSGAHGSVTLTGKWTPAMCQNLNKLKNVWASWIFSIDIDDDFAPSLLSQGFCGIGRWSFHANLESLDECIREEYERKPFLAATYQALTRAMEQHASKIEFVYADEESGNHFISTDAVTFAAKEGHLIIEQSIEIPHEYTWERYLALDFGGEEQFAELMDDLLDLISTEMNQRDAIRSRVEEWAKEHTLPHACADLMGKEKTEKFRAAYSAQLTTEKKPTWKYIDAKIKQKKLDERISKLQSEIDRLKAEKEPYDLLVAEYKAIEQDHNA